MPGKNRRKGGKKQKNGNKKNAKSGQKRCHRTTSSDGPTRKRRRTNKRKLASPIVASTLIGDEFETIGTSVFSLIIQHVGHTLDIVRLQYVSRYFHTTILNHDSKCFSSCNKILLHGVPHPGYFPLKLTIVQQPKTGMLIIDAFQDKSAEEDDEHEWRRYMDWDRNKDLRLPSVFETIRGQCTVEIFDLLWFQVSPDILDLILQCKRLLVVPHNAIWRYDAMNRMRKQSDSHSFACEHLKCPPKVLKWLSPNSFKNLRYLFIAYEHEQDKRGAAQEDWKINGESTLQDWFEPTLLRLCLDISENDLPMSESSFMLPPVMGLRISSGLLSRMDYTQVQDSLYVLKFNLYSRAKLKSRDEDCYLNELYCWQTPSEAAMELVEALKVAAKMPNIADLEIKIFCNEAMNLERVFDEAFDLVLSQQNFLKGDLDELERCEFVIVYRKEFEEFENPIEMFECDWDVIPGKIFKLCDRVPFLGDVEVECSYGEEADMKNPVYDISILLF